MLRFFSLLAIATVTVVAPYTDKYIERWYTLATGDVLSCWDAWEDDCGWHLRQCGYKRNIKFDCLIVDEVRDAK